MLQQDNLILLQDILDRLNRLESKIDATNQHVFTQYMSSGDSIDMSRSFIAGISVAVSALISVLIQVIDYIINNKL